MGITFAAAVGMAGLVIGQWMSGGAVLELLQPISLAMIFVGTAAAVMLSFPARELRTGSRQLLPSLGSMDEAGIETLLEEITLVAQTARKEGFLALDSLRNSLRSPSLRDGVKYLMDGFDAHQIRELYDAQTRVARDRLILPSRIWEAAGAYAPTMGVIVAALGLMRVLSNLDDIAKLGAGISVAFVSLIYGILLSNLFFLPFANRVRRNVEGLSLPYEMVKAAILSIQEGLNPQLIEEKMKQMLPPKAG